MFRDVISLALLVFCVLDSESCRLCRLHGYIFVLLTKSKIDVWSFLTFWEIKFSLSVIVLQYLITHFSDFELACLGSFFIHEGVFFLSGLPFIWLERAGWLSKYKIQVCPFSNLLLSQILNVVCLFSKMEIQCFIVSFWIFRMRISHD